MSGSETADAPEEQAPEAAPAEEAADAPEEQAPEAAPAEEAADAPVPEADEGAPPADEIDPSTLTPKERKRLERRSHTGEAKPERGVEERTAERLAKRKANADTRRRYRARSREKRRSGGAGTAPAPRAGTGSPRVLRGVVVSDKADKTVTVRIDVARQHRTYGKIVRSSSKLAVHDERNEANAGDTVRVVESRPLSRSKRWRLIEVVERAR